MTTFIDPIELAQKIEKDALQGDSGALQTDANLLNGQHNQELWNAVNSQIGDYDKSVASSHLPNILLSMENGETVIKATPAAPTSALETLKVGTQAAAITGGIGAGIGSVLPGVGTVTGGLFGFGVGEAMALVTAGGQALSNHFHESNPVVVKSHNK